MGPVMINLLPIGLAVGAAVFWAMGQIMAKTALKYVSMSAYAVSGALFSLPFIIFYALLTGGLTFPDLGLVLVAAVGGFTDLFIGLMLYVFAIKRMAVHRATSLANIAPFWGALTAMLFLGESAKIAIFASAILIVLGSFFVTSKQNTNHSDTQKLGTILALFAGFAWGVAEVVPAKYCLNHGMPLVTYLFILVTVAGTAWCILAVVNWIKGRFRYSMKGIGISAISGFFICFLGWFLWLSALRIEQASVLAPIRGLLVLFTFLFSILFLREKPTKKAFLGMVIILSGIVYLSLSI